MKPTKLLKFNFLALISAFLITFSCTKDEEERITVKDTEDISEEALVDSYFQDQDDMTEVAIAAPSDADFGRTKGTITINDSRFKCSGVTITHEKTTGSTNLVPKGTITVDFGAGCTDAQGNVRTGKLILTYTGWRHAKGSTVVTTTENYTINGVKLEGTRTLTNISENREVPKFEVVLVNGKATFPDGSEATRQSQIIWQWVKGAAVGDGYLLIDKSSTASGKTRAGRSYVVTLEKDLKYKRLCGGIAVEGIKKFTIENGKIVTIDFGDGTCDKSLTVSTEGVTRNIEVK